MYGPSHGLVLIFIKVGQGQCFYSSQVIVLVFSSTSNIPMRTGFRGRKSHQTSGKLCCWTRAIRRFSLLLDNPIEFQSWLGEFTGWVRPTWRLSKANTLNCGRNIQAQSKDQAQPTGKICMLINYLCRIRWSDYVKPLTILRPRTPSLTISPILGPGIFMGGLSSEVPGPWAPWCPGSLMDPDRPFWGGFGLFS